MAKKPVKAALPNRVSSGRIVREHAGDHASDWAAMRSIAEEVGCLIYAHYAQFDLRWQRLIPLSPVYIAGSIGGGGM